MSKKNTLVSFIVLLTINVYSQDILFLGNSIFSYNDVPEKLDTLCQSHSLDCNIVDACKDGYLLSNHFEDSTSLKIITETDWDYVVVTGYNTIMRSGGTHHLEKLLDTLNCDIVLVQPISGYIPKKFRKRQLVKFRDMINTYSEDLKRSLKVNVGDYIDCYLDINPAVEFLEDGIHPNDFGASLIAYGVFSKIFPKAFSICQKQKDSIINNECTF